jgi:hypothetical protein
MEGIQQLHGWEKVDSPEGLFAYTRHNEGSDIKSLKIDFYADKPAGALCDFMFRNYTRIVKEVGGEMADIDIIHTYGENAHIFKEVFTPPVGVVSPRETICYHMKLATGEGMFATIATSVSEVEPETEGKVRAQLNHLVHLFEPTPEDANRTHITVSYNSDPKGSLPSALANKILTKRIGLYEKACDMFSQDL